MKFCLVIHFIILFFFQLCSINRSEISDLKGGRVKPDTSYVYYAYHLLKEANFY